MKKFNLTRLQKIFIGAFLVLAAYALFTRFLDGAIIRALSAAVKGASPIVAGFIIAFLLGPIINRMEKWKVFKIFSRFKSHKKIVRAVSIILLYITLFCIVGLFIAFLTPSIYENGKELLKKAPAYFETAGEWIDNQLKSRPWLANADFTDAIERVRTSVIGYFQSNAPGYIEYIGRFLYGTGVFVYNSIMAFLVAYFLLYDKERFAVWFGKLWRAIVNNDYVYSQSVSFMRDANKVFSNYIVGRLIESLIVSLITLIVFAIMGIKYSFLIAFIVGVTNLIPYFGPFIGGAISVILMMFENPDKIIFVIIFLVVLQQIDSFVITPLVLGDRLKVNALWVVVGVIIGGSMFGVLGMILGAPVAAITVNTIERFVKWRQTQRNNINSENKEEVT